MFLVVSNHMFFARNKQLLENAIDTPIHHQHPHSQNHHLILIKNIYHTHKSFPAPFYTALTKLPSFYYISPSVPAGKHLPSASQFLQLQVGSLGSSMYVDVMSGCTGGQGRERQGSVPRPKMGSVYSYMSERKIIRLKTPLKSRDETKLSESTHISGMEFNQESTILLVKNVTCSEELQVTLINEINKLYREIGRLKQVVEEEAVRKEQQTAEGRSLRSRIEVLEREHQSAKEMLQVERDNHDRLRRFYEQREKEWVLILTEHKRILEECTHSISDVRPSSELSQLQSMYTTLENMLSQAVPRDTSPPQREPHFGTRRKLRSSLQREDSLSEPKLKLKLSSHREIGREVPQKRLQRTPLKARQDDPPKLQRQPTPAVKNLQADELFDSILRKTYYRYKEKAIAVSEIEQLEDMVKLKNAKTSTRERLAKTIRKLDFQIGSDQELKVLCDCVERAVLEKHKALRGDYAYELLVEKLKECERLALSSNSELERLDKSHLSEGRSRCLYVDHSVLSQESALGKQRTIELLLDSSIKEGLEEDLSQRIKFTGMRRCTSEVQELAVQSRCVSKNEESLLH